MKKLFLSYIFLFATSSTCFSSEVDNDVAAKTYGSLFFCMMQYDSMKLTDKSIVFAEATKAYHDALINLPTNEMVSAFELANETLIYFEISTDDITTRFKMCEAAYDLINI